MTVYEIHIYSGECPVEVEVGVGGEREQNKMEGRVAH